MHHDKPCDPNLVSIQSSLSKLPVYWSHSQVEVYTNTTELWSKRQTLLVQTYASFSDRDMEHTKFIEEDTGEGREEVVEEEKQGIGTDGEGWFKWVLTLNSVEEVQEEEVDEYINERTRGGLGDDVKFTVPSYVEQHSLYELFDVYSKFSLCVHFTCISLCILCMCITLTQTFFWQLSSSILLITLSWNSLRSQATSVSLSQLELVSTFPPGNYISV